LDCACPLALFTRITIRSKTQKLSNDLQVIQAARQRGPTDEKTGLNPTTENRNCSTKPGDKRIQPLNL
jgi:hypothetical protein